MMKELNAKLIVNLFFVVLLSAVPTVTARALTISGNNVGIGTNTPSQSLDVVGNINASGSITANIFNGSGAGLTGISGANITTDSVGSGALTAGAVTAGKVAVNAISPVNIDYLGKVAIVATSGGNYNNPAIAMSDYQKWCGSAPSAANPCLLKIMPGLYNVGTSSLQMQAYLDIEGSGENTTIIQGSVDGNFTGVVTGANHAEIRFLSVHNTGGGEYANAIYNYMSSPKITNVTATASGGNVSIGISNLINSSPTMINVTATASGSVSNVGVSNKVSSSPIMTNVTATASGGTSNGGVYNDSSSPTMTNVTATALGGDTNNFGIYNFSSTTIMTNVTATASGNNISNRGVENNQSSPTMTNVISTASGNSQENRGIDNYVSTSTMNNIIATATGGTNNYGVYNFSFTPSAIAKINNSVIKGATNTVYNYSGATIFVANTQLDGGVVFNEGTITCVGTYNAYYIGLNTSCQ